MVANADVIVTIQLQLEKEFKKLDQLKKKVSTTANGAVKGFSAYEKQLAKVDKVQQTLNRSLTRNRQEFQAWALGIMFFGMSVQRIFTSIFRSASRTFNEVSSSVEGSTTEFNKLEGSLSFLKFVAGEALEPIAAALIPIVDKISEWINENPQIFRQLVAIAGIVGTLLITIGTTVLAVSSLQGAWAKVLGIISKVKVGISGLGSLGGLTSSLSIISGLTFAGLLAVGALTWKALKETPEAWESIKNSVKELDTPLKNLTDSFNTLFDSLFADFEEFDSFWETIATSAAFFAQKVTSLVSFVLNSLSLLASAGAELIEVFKAAWAAVSGDTSGFKKAKEAIAEIDSLQNKLKGDILDNAELFNQSFGDFRSAIDKKQEAEPFAGFPKVGESFSQPQTINFNITQQSGESTEALTDRVISFFQSTQGQSKLE